MLKPSMGELEAALLARAAALRRKALGGLVQIQPIWCDHDRHATRPHGIDREAAFAEFHGIGTTQIRITEGIAQKLLDEIPGAGRGVEVLAVDVAAKAFHWAWAIRKARPYSSCRL